MLNAPIKAVHIISLFSRFIKISFACLQGEFEECSAAAVAAKTLKRDYKSRIADDAKAKSISGSCFSEIRAKRQTHKS